MKEQITYDVFDKIDIRIGTVISVKKNEKAKKPSLVVQVDFGKEIGIKQSSAQITDYYNEETLKRLSGLSKNYGFRLSIDRFGSSSVPFSYLQRIGLDIIKLDHGFIRDIQDNQSDQFFLHSAVQIAHSQEIKVMAVGVESAQEWDILKDLGLDGAMGYYLGRPVANDIF